MVILLHLKKVGTCAGLHIYNLGTGKGYSVLDVVKAFETASGRTVPYKLVDRRPGDIAEYWADSYESRAGSWLESDA